MALAAIAAVAQNTAPAPKGARRQAIAQAGQATPRWQEIDTGPFIPDTFMTERDGEVASLKGIAIKLGPERDVSVVFDTGLLAWRGIRGRDGARRHTVERQPWRQLAYPGGAGVFVF